MHTWTKL